MAKTDTRSPETPAKPASSGTDLAALEAKLGPLDEFRGRADSWMKEITAQVARLAGRSEEEERRKGAMDKRLNDIEDRMQSLLTLTEMVSLSKNPFAGPQRTPEAAPAPKQEATEAPPAEDAPETEAAPTRTAPEPTHVASPTPPQSEAAPVAPSPPAQVRAHPNDAMADIGAPAPTPTPTPTPPARADPEPTERSVADTFPQRTTRPSSGPGHANHRFFVLEWARLLAPAAERIDLSGFLGFYAESGWVNADIVATVRNLTLQLSRASQNSDSGMPLDELHARSILLLGRLQGTAPRPDAARATLMEAREAASGPWATIQG